MYGIPITLSKQVI